MNSAQLRRVTVESFAHYRDGLVELLLDAVQQGASLGFLQGITAPEAAAYFDTVTTELAMNSRVLWAVVKDERVLASVQLALCTKPNGLNRAEVQKLMVRGDSRRHGLGRQLMDELEAAALQKKRGLLYLDTEAGSAAEAFYQTQGYQRAGEIPDYACSPDGIYRPTALYYKILQGPFV